MIGSSAPPPGPVPASPMSPAPQPGGTLSLRAFLLRPFVVPFVLLLGVGGVVLYGVNRNDSALLRVLDAQARVQLIGNLTQQVSIMENGERGYVITGQAAFLQPYEDGQAAFQADAYALHDLSGPGQRAHLKRVEALVEEWQARAARPEILARRTSLDLAAAHVRSGVGLNVLNRARGVLAVMAADENVRLSEATQISQGTLRIVRWFSVGGLLLGILLLVVTAYRVTRTVSRSLAELNAGARALTQGQSTQPLPRTPVRELDSLGQQFELMAQAVQDREMRLTRVADALKSSNLHLERSNRELEQFAYVASHDLQEPLRTIGSYTELLARRYRGQLDERADQYMAFTISATHRMKTLIQDLLTYSRVRKASRTTQTVDTAALVAEVIRDLGVQSAASGAHVEVGPLPTIESNAHLLRHAFQNLIGNALKFTVPGRAPLVSVEATREPARWVFRVSDNGIGIDEAYHDRIFGVFQRLHGMDEYSGSGIGLAVTRSAAEQLGGELWVHSVPGQGSTFHLALPLIPPAPSGEPHDHTTR